MIVKGNNGERIKERSGGSEAVKRNFAVTPLNCLILNDVPIMNGLLCTIHLTARKSFCFT